MGYAELYGHCQGLGPRVSRKAVYPKVLALTGFNRISHVKTSLDPGVCRGMYISATNEKSRFVQQTGSRVIVTARDLNYCWERFVYIKELMHAFDDPSEATDSGDEFETLLDGFSSPSPTDLSLQAQSEINCFWMALGVVCPEPQRLEYEAKKAAKQIDDYAIALQLRIPEIFVPRLFEDRYKQNIREITGEAVLQSRATPKA